MLPLLFDEGAHSPVARALRILDLEAWAVGEPGAPHRGSSDADNAAWCSARGAVLVTSDRGRKNRAILSALATSRVHAIFLYKDLRGAPRHHLARALLRAEERMEQIAAGRRLIHHRLTPTGGLDER